MCEERAGYVIPALERLRQENCCEFRVSVGFIESSRLKKKN